MKNSLMITLLLVIAFQGFSQETNDKKAKLNVGADIFSRYVWRGQDYGQSPSLQPSISIVKGGFEAGVWGAYASNGGYSETDPYIKYTLKGLSLILTDYFIHNEQYSNNINQLKSSNFLHFDDKTTPHIFEGALQFKGGEKFPISIYAGTFFYGLDKGWGYDSTKDAKGDNYYSTYVEFGYTFNCNERKFDLFLGLTPFEGAYGNGFGVVNTGITGYRNIKITSDFELPVKATVAVNPQSENIYFVFGITF